jgi:hypothetical protein
VSILYRYICFLLVTLLPVKALLSQTGDTVQTKAADSLVQALVSTLSPADSLAQVFAKRDSIHRLQEAEYKNAPLSIRPINREDWNKARKGMEYSDVAPPKPKKPLVLPSRPAPVSSLFEGDGVKFVMVSLIIGLLAFLLFKLFSGRLNNQRVIADKPIVSIEDIEDISLVPESELERLLRQALEQRNYREAVRVYYVFILRELAEKDLIRWRKNKTNRDYLSELQPTAHYTVFRELTLLFDRIWYGDTRFEESDYTRIGPRFKTFAEALKLTTRIEKQ